MSEENKKSMLPLHLHVVKVGKSIDVAQLNIKNRQNDIENDIIRCPCCGHEFDITTIMSKMTEKKHNQSCNGYEYVQFKCPKCEAVIRTDPYLTSNTYSDPRKLLLEGKVVWLDSVKDFDNIPSRPGFTFEDYSSIVYHILLLLFMVSAIFGVSFGIIRMSIIPAIPLFIVIGILLAYRAFKRKRIMRIYETEKPDDIPEDDTKDVDPKYLLHHYY